MANEKKQIKALIKDVNNTTGSTVNYNDVYRNVQNIMSKEGAEREAAIIDYYKQLGKEIFDKVAETRTLSWTSAVFSEKYGTSRANYSIEASLGNAQRIVNRFIKMMDPSFAGAVEFNPDQLASMRDWQIEELKARDMYREINTALKSWTRECYTKEAELLTNALKDYSFTEDYKKPANQTVAQVYCKYKATKDELEKHGAVWRFFNFRKVAAYNHLIKSAEAAFEKIGFNVAEHGEKAVDFLKNTPFEPYGRDMELAESTYMINMENYKAKHTEAITISEDKYKRAIDLDKNPETSYNKKLEPIAQKYGMDVKEFDLMSSGALDFKTMANGYDKRRDVSNFKINSFTIFYKTFQYIVNSEISKGKEINITEILKDARHISVMMMEHYTPFYEIEELKGLEKPAYIGNFTPEKMADRVGMCLKKSNLSEEKTASIKSEASSLISEWLADPKKVLAEDQALADQYGGRNPEVTIVEDVKDVKEPISVDLEEPTSQIKPFEKTETAEKEMSLTN